MGFWVRKNKKMTDGIDNKESSLKDETEDKSLKREVVTKTEYILGLVGYAIGIGNLWRFPFLCGRNGGAAFLVAYFLCLFFVSLPAYMIEMVMGQYTEKSTIACLKSVHPIWQGLGWAQAFMLFWVLCYYNVVLAYPCIYIIGSLSNPFPWSPEYAGGNGSIGIGGDSSSVYWNQGVLNRFDSDVKGEQGFGEVDWKRSVALLFVWTIVFFAVGFGKKILAKVTWVTVVMPIVLVVILFFRAITLENAGEGVGFYIGKFEGSALAEPRVWRDALVQILFSLSPGMGTAITISSFTRVNENVHRACWITAMCNSGFSFFGGFAIFSFLGHICYKVNWQKMKDKKEQIRRIIDDFNAKLPQLSTVHSKAADAWNKVRDLDVLRDNDALKNGVLVFLSAAVKEMMAGITPAQMERLGHNLTKVDEDLALQTMKETAKAGPGLAFIALADGMQTFGGASNFFAVLLFLTLLTLGLDSTFAWAETWMSYVDDGFKMFNKDKAFEKQIGVQITDAQGRKSKQVPKIVSVALVVVVMFLLGLPFCTRLGHESLDTVDNFVGLMFLQFGVFVEGIIFVFFFKFERFEKALKHSCGVVLDPISRTYWLVTTHGTMWLVSGGLFIWDLVINAQTPYEDYPRWLLGIGWALLCVCVLLVALGIVVGTLQTRTGAQSELDNTRGALHIKAMESMESSSAEKPPA